MGTRDFNGGETWVASASFCIPCVKVRGSRGDQNESVVDLNTSESQGITMKAAIKKRAITDEGNLGNPSILIVKLPICYFDFGFGISFESGPGPSNPMQSMMQRPMPIPHKALIAMLARPQNASFRGNTTSRRDVLSIAITGPIAIATSSTWSLEAKAANQPSLPRKEVREAIDQALSRVMVKNKAAVCLRLAFHDAATFSLTAKDGGMNASIGYELDRPESFGLKRGWRAVLDLEKEIKGTPAEGVVSRADLAAFSGAAAVRICGGPDFLDIIPIGRTDATGPDPENRMPAETLSAAELKRSFADKGFSVRELVVLSGAHTIGGKGFGGPESFDNAYYTSLMKKPWLNKDDSMASMIGLQSDHVLPEDEECLAIIKDFANDQGAFFAEFGPAYVKMTQMGVQWRKV